MSLSPFFDTILSLHSNTMSLSPFDIKGKGRIKNQHALPLFSSCGRSILQIWYILKWPSSPWIHAESSNIFSNEVHDSMDFLSPMTHTYIKDPSKWIYIWDSNAQPSGFTYLNSTSQPSGFTILTQLPNQVGLQNLTQLPNQVGLQIWQVLTWLNITIFTSWVSTCPFHLKLKYEFS